MSKPQTGEVLAQNLGRIGIRMTKVAPRAEVGANMPTRYAIVPRCVLEDQALTDAAVRLYGILDARVGKHRSQQIRQDTLATDLGWSVSKVQRSLAELESAGLVAVQRTPRSSRYAVTNPARVRGTTSGTARHASSDSANLTEQPEWSVSPEVSDTSDLTEPLSSTSLRNTYMGGTPPRLSAASVPSSNAVDGARITHGSADRGMNDDAADIQRTNTYLAAITAATGIHLDANHLTVASIKKIHQHGLTAEDTARLAAAQLGSARGTIRNPSGFLVRVVLPHIAENRLNQPPRPTPAPPALHEISEAERCGHGEISGRCALCRQSWASKPTKARCIHYVTLNADGECPRCIRESKDAQRQFRELILEDQPQDVGCGHQERRSDGKCLRCATEVAAAKAAIAATETRPGSPPATLDAAIAEMV